MRIRKNKVRSLLALISAGLVSQTVWAAEKRVSFDIPSQPMNAALIEFSQQSGMQIAVNATHINDLHSRGVTSTLGCSEALKALLKGTSLTFEIVGEETIVVKRDANAGKSQLILKHGNTQPRASVTEIKGSKKGVEPTKTSEKDSLERISVVGSAIASRRLKLALPVAVYGRDAIDAAGVSDGNELARFIPQMGDITWNESWIPASSNAARGDMASLNLKNLGASSTLLLINGRRSVIHPTTSTVDDAISTTTFNTNAIPLYGSDRVEVLFDGAAAIYGSDAIAGVVNIVTRKNIVGAGIKLKYGSAEGSHRSDTELTGYFGRDFDRARGNISVMYNYTKRTPQYASDYWYTATSDHRDFFTNSDLQGTASLDTRSVYTPWGNFIAPYKVMVNGEPLTSLAGVFHSEKSTSENCIASSQAQTCYVAGTVTDDYLYDAAASNIWITPGVERFNIFSTLSYQLTLDTELFGEASLYKAKSDYLTTAGAFSVNTPVYIAADAYYNPLGSRYLADGTLNPNRLSGLSNVPDSGLVLELKNYRFIEGGNRNVDVDNTQSRFVLGLKGITEQNIGWESALLYSRGKASDVSEGYSVSAFAEAVSLPTDSAFNPFNGDFPDAENTTDQFSVIAQRTSISEVASWDFKLTTQEFLSLPAGDLGVATGMEIRYESLSDDRDPLVDGTQTYTDWYTGYEYASDLAGTSPTPDSHGSRNVKSFYVELGVPLVSPEFSLPLVRSLDVQLAGRYENYSDVGSIAIPKIAAVWSLNDALLVRSSLSRGFKAPNLEVLNVDEIARYNNHTDYIFCEAALRKSIIDNYADCTANYSVSSSISGNENLTPERSINRSYGFIFTPSAFNSDSSTFSVSLDAWHVSIQDRVGVVSVPDVIARDLLLRTTANTTDSRIRRDDANSDEIALFSGTGLIAAGDIISIQMDYKNQNSLEVKGADISMDWSLTNSESGDFNVNITLSKLLSYRQALTSEMVEVKEAQEKGLIDAFLTVGSGDETGVDGMKPEWKGSARFTWRIKNLWYRLSAQYTHSVYDGKYASGADFEVPSQTIFNTSVKYRFNNIGKKTIDAEIGVRNLFAKEPPLNATGNYLANLYLPYSRFLYASAEVRF